MATVEFAGKLISDPLVKGAMVSYFTFSGVVTVDGSFSNREIIGYNTARPDLPYTTISDETTGEWELSIKMGLAEKARIICVGETGEQSVVHEHLVE